MGDVYRLVFVLETFFQPLSYRTVSDNHGQLIAWRQARMSVPERRLEELGRLPFHRAITEKGAFRLAPLEAIIAELRAGIVA